jgi:hypothetical protein
MRKLLYLFFLLPSAGVIAQKGIRESIQFDKPPVIDGKVDEWPGDWWLDPDGKFLTNIGNDADNLYIRMKVSDDLTQQKIGLFGLSLRLNPNGKRKGKVGLKYPVGKDPSELKKERQEAMEKGTDLAERVQMKKDLINDVEVVELIGLAKQNIVSSRLGLMNGIEAIIVAQDDGAYIYEAKIPFKAFRIKKSEVTLMGVEFETGRLVVQNKSAGTNPTGPGPGSRGPGSYGQQPRYYSNNYQYNVLSSAGYLWIGVKLK